MAEIRDRQATLWNARGGDRTFVIAYFAVCVLLRAPVGMGGEPLPESADPNRQSVASPVSPAAGPAEIIKSIEFEGNRKYKDHVLRDRLGFALGDRLDPFLAEGGRLTITEVYRKVGYPRVEVSLDRAGLDDGHLLYRIEEGPCVQIESINFVGNDAFNAGTLKQIIKLKEKKWLLWPVSYTEEAVEEDLDRLREFYYDHGYLDYEIQAQTEFAADGAGVHLTFLLEEGPPYRVGEIIFRGNTHFTDDQLRVRTELSEAQVYLKPVAQRDARELTRLYHEHGFVDAVVRQNPRFMPQVSDNLVTVEFEVVEGGQFRIGRIDVAGNEVTQDKVVRRVLDEYGFTPGELYDARMAPKEGGGLLERYVQRTTVAEEVLIRPVDPPDGDPGRKDVRVNIEEGSTGMIVPSVGFSTDHGVVGRLMYRQSNLDITDWPENLGELFPPTAFRGGGQRLSVILQPGTRYSQYMLEFEDPYWRDEPVTFNLSGRSWERFRESYDEERLRAATAFEQRVDTRWRRSIGFRAENVAVDDLDYDAPQEIRDVEGDTMLFGIKLGAGVADVDDIYNPSRGHRLSAFYEQVAGDSTFGLLEGTYIRYFTLHEDVLERKTILATKVLAGTVVGDAPPFEQFYGGGTGHYGLRGFEYRGVSTRGLQTNVLVPQRKDPIGSEWIFMAGAELVFPLVGENFSGLLFIDSGTVDTGSYRLSIGTGIQVRIPQLFREIPMRFEIAIPLLKDDEDETQLFSFSQPGYF